LLIEHSWLLLIEHSSTIADTDVTYRNRESVLS